VLLTLDSLLLLLLQPPPPLLLLLRTLFTGTLFLASPGRLLPLLPLQPLPLHVLADVVVGTLGLETDTLGLVALGVEQGSPLSPATPGRAATAAALPATRELVAVVTTFCETSET